jgi:hypothetical protein
MRQMVDADIVVGSPAQTGVNLLAHRGRRYVLSFTGQDLEATTVCYLLKLIDMVLYRDVKRRLSLGIVPSHFTDK